MPAGLSIATSARPRRDVEAMSSPQPSSLRPRAKHDPFPRSQPLSGFRRTIGDRDQALGNRRSDLRTGRCARQRGEPTIEPLARRRLVDDERLRVTARRAHWGMRERIDRALSTSTSI
jgi:hypothetical protein